MKLVAWVVCLLVLLTARPAGATDCMASSPQERFAAAHTVVIGTVTAADLGVLVRSGNTIRIPEQGIPHQLEIERIYKGEAGPSLTVYQRGVLGAPDLQAGDRWLLFLHTDNHGNLTAGPCTPSTKLAPDSEPSSALLAVLGAGGQPGETVRGSRAPWVATGIFMGGAGLYLVWRFRSRKSQ